MFVAGTVALFALYGCSAETRYQTLSFFFDGVPQPEERISDPLTGSMTKTGPKQAVPFRYHGPYAAKLCWACHQQDGGNKLILPVEKLCLNCHDLNIQKKHIHGPVAAGGCRICHDPHGSGKAFLLVAEPSTFCFYCHDEAEIKTREVHKSAGSTQCTVCHNPHGSDNNFLLK